MPSCRSAQSPWRPRSTLQAQPLTLIDLPVRPESAPHCSLKFRHSTFAVVTGREEVKRQSPAVVGFTNVASGWHRQAVVGPSYEALCTLFGRRVA